MAANIMKPPVEGGAPPAPPFDLPSFNADEGPMRAELRRQIASLESELSGVIARSCPWEPHTVNALRGPAVQNGAALEEIRDELLASLHALCRRIEGAIDQTHVNAAMEAAGQKPQKAKPVEPSRPEAGEGGESSDGRAPWRRLTRR